MWSFAFSRAAKDASTPAIRSDTLQSLESWKNPRRFVRMHRSSIIILRLRPSIQSDLEWRLQRAVFFAVHAFRSHGVWVPGLKRYSQIEVNIGRFERCFTATGGRNQCSARRCSLTRRAVIH